MDASAFRGDTFGGHTTVTHKSICGKLCNSLMGVVVGIVLFFVGFPLLAWNENNYIRVWESLAEGLQKVESVPDVNYLDNSLSGNLVHIAGPLSNVPVLRDEEFGVSVRGVQLERVVEMFQYKEHRSTRTQRTSTGGERRVTSYSYSPDWSSQVITSGSFHDPTYTNPGSLPFIQRTFTARDVSVGAYSLTAPQLGQLGSGTSVPMTPSTLAIQGGGAKTRRQQEEEVVYEEEEEEEEEEGGEDPWAASLDDYGENDYEEAPPAPKRRGRKAPKKAARTRKAKAAARRSKSKASRSRSRSRSRGGRGAGQVASLNGMVPTAPAAADLVVTGSSLYLGLNPSRPEVGDTRITWRVVDPGAASLIGKQQGSSIAPFKTSNGYEVYLVSGGHQQAQEMFDGAHSQNSVFTWFLRVGGWALMFIGLRMVVEPAVLAPQLIPCIGGILSDVLACGACVATCSVASAFALVTIALAWFAVRPSLSAALLVVAGITVVAARATSSGTKTGGRGGDANGAKKD